MTRAIRLVGRLLARLLPPELLDFDAQRRSIAEAIESTPIPPRGGHRHG